VLPYVHRLTRVCQKFADFSVTQTLLAYLARYKEFGGAHEKMKRVVALLHRQAVKAKAEGLFFNVGVQHAFTAVLHYLIPHD
jgi:replication fork protection complex subunit Tof1/Swi1